jgi:L,D-peptidoglycan transpeptidase YkuD (ErfK/YbiS/YcfS/YnhG family)
MTSNQNRAGTRLVPIVICSLLMTLLLSGCSHVQSGSIFAEANDFFSQGNYRASLDTYEQLGEKHPAARDRVLFEMGVIHAYPKNEQKDYQKAIESFQALLKDYPDSAYRQNSETMIFTISNVMLKDGTIAEQQRRIDALRQEVKGREGDISALQEEIRELEQKVFDFATRSRAVDRILIEKKERRLTLLSKGEAVKVYRIALGGNPVGPKERQGDNKTPEGIYVIDSRNKDSQYHLSLHISYPNDRDKKRAKELGVSPGGNIMIHGIKNGFSWVGDAHADIDWTKGCIAVTDEEIEEIARTAPTGTVVEIRP